MNSDARKDLIDILSRLGTEQVNPDTVEIDTLPPLEIVRKINNEDKKVAQVVEKTLPQIAVAAETAAAALKNGGRIIYIGAGTSGRLGVLDAAECPPTFGTDPSQVVGLISGGYDTLLLSIEGAEDHTDWAVEDLDRIRLDKSDFVIGIAASVRTPYTLAGVEYAISQGCRTALIVCNKTDILKIKPDILIELPVGAEAITGSTRMKSGTAQKMTLNMITTAAMILLGKTYGNLMVDLKARSEKLESRSRKILMDFLGIDYDEADRLLKEAGDSVKTAIVMKKLSVSRDEAEEKLIEADGFLKRIF
ncbi:MAG: N-acetylmuramic acid 6-phosphate etherase [candidate division Zixibacteria bacterium HGW-Zixibacteria-1]|nr:MAG: N-acetylmuramic acid 6-phosphate etherase [candidate division Zixibacteria bacterium HGW-Zixibacteria-1]